MLLRWLGSVCYPALTFCTLFAKCDIYFRNQFKVVVALHGLRWDHYDTTVSDRTMQLRMYVCLFSVIVAISQTNVITGQGEDRSPLDLEARVVALEHALSTLKTELYAKVASLKCDCSRNSSGLGTINGQQTGKRLLGENFAEGWGDLDSIWVCFLFFFLWFKRL